MYVNSKDISYLENIFYKKFKKFPYITFKELGDGDFFCLMLTDVLGRKDRNYYKMGLTSSVASAEIYINGLIKVPLDALTFETQEEKRKYIVESMQEELRRLHEETHENFIYKPE